MTRRLDLTCRITVSFSEIEVNRWMIPKVIAALNIKQKNLYPVSINGTKVAQQNYILRKSKSLGWNLQNIVKLVYHELDF